MTNFFKHSMIAGICAVALCLGQMGACFPAQAQVSTATNTTTGTTQQNTAQTSSSGSTTSSTETSSGLNVGSVLQGAGSLGSNFGSLGNVAGKVTSNIGKNWDDLKKVNMDSIYGDSLNMLKDTFPELKGLLALEMDNLSVDGVLDALAATGAGIPITSIDMPIVTVDMVASAVATTGALTTQLDAETGYTSVLGNWGNKDGRNGECMIDGCQYGPMLDQFIDTVLLDLEGYYGLYIDTECYPTTGVGSLMKEVVYGRSNYDIFLEMDYQDASGASLDLATKQSDLARIRSFESQCRAGAFNPYSRTGGWWTKNEFAGRKLSYPHAHKMAFDEFCNTKVPPLHRKFAERGIRFCELPIPHQVALLDIAYQAGGGFTGWSQAGPLLDAVKNGNCTAAANNFSGWNLCTKYSNRCKTRLGLFREPCSGGTCVGGSCSVN